MNTARHREDPVPLVIRATTDSIHAAVVRLRTGGVVAFPTETVYGLGADAGNAAAVAKIFELKGRPADHPLIVHLASALALAAWAAVVPPAAARLAALFWPGPLTMILPRAPGVMDAVTGGQATVGVRCPAHPLALQLLRECAKQGIAGLAAPSANRFGHVSPTTAAHVRAEFGADLMVLDGGPAAVGIESTIVDLSGVAPRILRPGVITEAQIAEALAFTIAAAVDAILLMSTAAIGLAFILKGKVQQHRQWMTRSYAVALVFFEVRLISGVFGLDDKGLGVAELIVWVCLALAIPLADLALQIQESFRSPSSTLRHRVPRESDSL